MEHPDWVVFYFLFETFPRGKWATESTWLLFIHEDKNVSKRKHYARLCLWQACKSFTIKHFLAIHFCLPPFQLGHLLFVFIQLLLESKQPYLQVARLEDTSEDNKRILSHDLPFPPLLVTCNRCFWEIVESDLFRCTFGEKFLKNRSIDLLEKSDNR